MAVPNKSLPTMYTVDDLVNQGFARSTVYHWYYTGQLPGRKVGRRILFTEAEVLEFFGVDAAE